MQVMNRKKMMTRLGGEVNMMIIDTADHPEGLSVQLTEQETEKQPGQQPESQAEQQPEKQPEKQPEQQPEKQDEQQPEKQPEKQDEQQPVQQPEQHTKQHTQQHTQQHTKCQVEDDVWARLTTSFDILLINGLATESSGALSIWGFHPNDPWWRQDHNGGHVYLVEWESETLSKIMSLVMDTAVKYWESLSSLVPVGLFFSFVIHR